MVEVESNRNLPVARVRASRRLGQEGMLHVYILSLPFERQTRRGAQGLSNHSPYAVRWKLLEAATVQPRCKTHLQQPNAFDLSTGNRHGQSAHLSRHHLPDRLTAGIAMGAQGVQTLAGRCRWHAGEQAAAGLWIEQQRK